MQKRAGLLYLTKSGKILLVLEDGKWSVPTFLKKETVLKDAEILFDEFSVGKILPIELYLSEDRGFEYGTYVCLVDKEFFPQKDITFLWGKINDLPKQLHVGLKNTLNNILIKTKIETILELANA